MTTMIIGYGNLGKIYAAALLREQLVTEQKLIVLCKTAAQAQLVKTNGHGTPVLSEHPARHSPDLVLLAVKPQDAPSIYEVTRKYLHKNTLVLSVMAGISTNSLVQNLGHDKIVRAMPNAPISLGMGMTAYSPAARLGSEETARARTILEATGKTLFVADEEQLHAITALSGSGPAYFFYLLQHMIDAGCQMGLTNEDAVTLVKQTMLGAFHLYDRPGKTTHELIRAVASKGGTTEAALKEFGKYEMGQALVSGILAACKRSQELGERNNHAQA